VRLNVDESDREEWTDRYYDDFQLNYVPEAVEDGYYDTLVLDES
jgi:hypothetical protein